MLLSRKQYSDWREIQDKYDDYMASVDFETLIDVQNYIKMDYKLTADKAQKEINKLNESSNDIVEIDT
jgi:hypothetical protein